MQARYLLLWVPFQLFFVGDAGVNGLIRWSQVLWQEKGTETTENREVNYSFIV